MRKFIFAIILLLAVIFLIASFSELQEIALTLQSGQWHFVALAILVEVLLLFTIAANYQQIYRIVCIDESLARLFCLSTAAFFISIVTPASGGMPAAAIFLGDAHRRNHKVGRVMTAWAVYVVFDYIGLLLITLLGMYILMERNNLHWPEIFAFLVLLVLASGLSFLLYLAMKNPVKLGHVLAWSARRVNWVTRLLTHRDYLAVDRAYSFARDAADGMASLHSRPRDLLNPLMLSIATKTLMVVLLLLMFLAFNVPFTASTLIAGFSIGYLFVIVSPTPSGIGVVEGILALTLNSLGVSLGAATVISLSFRGLTFWLPFVIGIFTFRRISN